MIFPADAMTNSRHGEIGDAASSPIIETYATIGSFKGTTLLTATPAIAIASRMHVPGRESVNATRKTPREHLTTAHPAAFFQIHLLVPAVKTSIPELHRTWYF